MNLGEKDRCTHRGCTKLVSNRQMKCLEHRTNQCKRQGCLKRIEAGRKFCADHDPIKIMCPESRKEYIVGL